MLTNVQSIKRARSVYAVSCTTSPGGKHRGLAGSVAVLIAESLLMLGSPYTRRQAKSTSFLNVFFAGGVTPGGLACDWVGIDRDRWMMTT
jgi:hypothetical protein